jgi:hypothetical protein
MYRYGDGTPFPLDENFIETLTAAVEACTNAFDPLTELDDRRDRAKDGRRDADREIARLEDLERTLAGSLTPYVASPGTAPDKKPGVTQTVAQRIAAGAKQAVAEARQQLENRVRQLENQALPNTVGDAIVKALRPFFDAHQLPKSAWIMSWDVRGAEPAADAVCTAGRISAAFALSPEPFRTPIRCETLSEGVVVHMMRKGVFGKAKAAPIDLGKYVIVAFERSATERTITLRESAAKNAPGLRFAVTEAGATWVSISGAGDAEGEANPLDMEDVAPVRLLAERATATFKDLTKHRTLVDLTFNGASVTDLDEPRIVPLELLQQLTPLARSIRERSRASGELVLKRDIGDNRREELFVPRATLAQQFARLPADYRKAFEDMGITAEETQPAINLGRVPAPPRADSAVELDPDLD